MNIRNQPSRRKPSLSLAWLRLSKIWQGHPNSVLHVEGALTSAGIAKSPSRRTVETLLLFATRETFGFSLQECLSAISGTARLAVDAVIKNVVKENMSAHAASQLPMELANAQKLRLTPPFLPFPHQPPFASLVSFPSG
jgi:hypothetical protein